MTDVRSGGTVNAKKEGWREGWRKGVGMTRLATKTYLIPSREAAAVAGRQKEQRPVDDASDLLILPSLESKMLVEGEEEIAGKEEEKEAKAQAGGRGTKASTATASRRGKRIIDMQLLTLMDNRSFYR